MLFSWPVSFPQPLDPTLEAEIEEAVTKKSKKRKGGVLGSEAVAEVQGEQARVIYVARIPHGFYEDQMSGEGNRGQVKGTEEDTRTIMFVSYVELQSVT